MSEVCKELHSVRLFPKSSGANAYRLTGIAARCDWILLSDVADPKVSLLKRVQGTPKTVFISLREPFEALRYFHDEVMPQIHASIVLITGSEDVTVPVQIDHRWRKFDTKEREMLERIRIDRRVTAWFAENLDTSLPKMHPLPTGMVPPESAFEEIIAPEKLPNERELRVLCAHRIRAGEQWQSRRTVSELCRRAPKGLCTVVDGELDQADFSRVLCEHAFVLCVEGGGLDPSPKAWQALLNGAIPIVRRTPTSEAYKSLPVAFVDEWSDQFLNRNWLETQRTSLMPLINDELAQRNLGKKLRLEYWWSRVHCFVRR